ncbi:fibrobacter succinogenes major paralogous domain-containing protein [Fibrobacter sp. UWEL]|uniref:fibrobacter succinogenes major paralogous domain-containing protein n=1 Tax=Fibrobacter sp. UWEL TaxID=1896209 RepID=UPI00090F9564|nr:fibrobacter succinogenes major paralogous domain-containing protein [Fibrobacter sp. UWEL]SHK95408.1 major paralogous domain-containing protein [Fibrobacter sp. UWEL]
MRTRLFWMLPLICAPLAFWACGGDSGTSVKDDESSSCSSSVIPGHDRESSSSAKSSSSVAKSSSSVNSSSSEVVQLIPYTTECPSGKTCTYAPTEHLNPDIAYGELLDTRDNQVYKTVTIGEQIWMAQNLNYAYNEPTSRLDSSSFCYNNSADSCAKYGRLYLWSAAMDSAAVFSTAGKGCGYGFGTTCESSGTVRGVCPEGWLLPNKDEWGTLISTVGGSANIKLKSTSGWNDSGNGTDSFGFGVLPAGDRYDSGDFSNAGSLASFWSSTEIDSGYAYTWYFHYNVEFVSRGYGSKDYGYSVRCLRD